MLHCSTTYRDGRRKWQSSLYVQYFNSDTEGTFRPERIQQIATRFDLDPAECLDNIIYARAQNSEHQMELLNDVCVRLCEDRQFKLVVIDSIIACVVILIVSD